VSVTSSAYLDLVRALITRVGEGQAEQKRQAVAILADSVRAGGVIQAAIRDPWRERRVNLETVRQVMRIIRGQSRAIRSDVDAEPNLIDMEDPR